MVWVALGVSASSMSARRCPCALQPVVAAQCFTVSTPSMARLFGQVQAAVAGHPAGRGRPVLFRALALGASSRAMAALALLCRPAPCLG